MPERPVTVVVTSVGSGVALSIVKALRHANATADRGYRIVGVDASWRAGALYVLDGGYLVPRADEPGYAARLAEVCRDCAAGFLIPGSDPELKAIAEARHRIEQATGTHVVVNPAEVIDVGYDKLRTAQFLEASGLPYPVTQRVGPESDADLDLAYPYVIKPRYGSGSVGLGVVHTARMHSQIYQAADDELVAQEYLDGPELTCGVAFGPDGRLVSSIVLERTLKKGFTQFAQVVDQPDVTALLHALAECLPGRGAYNVQGRLTDRGFVVFEINPRFSGTTGFRAVAGQNEPDLYLQSQLSGRPAEVHEIRTGLYMARYLAEVYFDDSALADLRNDRLDAVRTARSGFTLNIQAKPTD